MLNLKIFLPILGLLLSFVTMAADNSIGHDHGKADLTGSTYTAQVISPKAIVYADENMLSPLGYISNGKTILVGNPRRMNRDLVPLIIYGKLAFIEIKDIRYDNKSEEDYTSKRGAPREHNFDAIIESPAERLSENNSLYLGLQRYTSGDDTKNAFSLIDNESVSSFTGFHAQFIHRQLTSRFLWGFGVDYSSVSSTNMQFSYWMLTPTLGYSLIKSSSFLLDIYASLDLAITSELNIATNSEKEDASYVYGVQANARLVFLPNSKYHPMVGVGIRKYTVTGIATVKDATGNSVEGIQGVLGVGLFVGLGIEFK